MTVEEKVAVAKRIHDLAVGRYGLRPSDLVFDLLTFTIGSGDASLRGRGGEHPRGVAARQGGAARRLHLPGREQHLLRPLPRLPEGIELRLPPRGGRGRARHGHHRRGKDPADVEDRRGRPGNLPRPDPQPPADRRRVAAVRLHPPFRGRSRSRRRDGPGEGRPRPPAGGGARRKGAWPATRTGWRTSWRSCCPAARRRRSSTSSWSPRCATSASCSAGGRCSSPSCSSPRR